MQMDVHNDVFLSASLIGEAMQSMVNTVSRRTGKNIFSPMLRRDVFRLQIELTVTLATRLKIDSLTTWS